MVQEKKLPPVRRESCGTLTGRNAHVVAGEESCDPCKAAHAAYMRKHRLSRQPPAKTIQEASYRAQRVARDQLASEFPDRYTELYLEALRAETRRSQEDESLV